MAYLITDEIQELENALTTLLTATNTKLDTIITALNLVNTKLAGGLPSALTTDKLKVSTL